MGKCRYCGQPAGLFKKAHAQCQADADLKTAKLERGRDSIILLATAAALGKRPLEEAEAEMRMTATSLGVPDDELHGLSARAWQSAVSEALQDGILTEEEEEALQDFSIHFDLDEEELGDAFDLVTKAAVLRDVLDGKVPDRGFLAGVTPFNLQKNETLVWVWPSATFYEERTRTHYEGRSAGASVRIAKGVYYRTGTFRGHPVQTSSMQAIDSGMLGLTSKHIYFSGASKGFRIALAKVAAFTPYSDGIGVQREAATARPQAFVNGDGWFTYNLVSNLAQL